jgi:replicative DNA helicase
MRDPCANPFALDTYAQHQVIAALMRQNHLADELGIIGDHLPDPKCRRIIEVALQQHVRGEAFDEYTVAPHLEEEERAVLADALEEAGDLSLIPSYAGTLRDKYLLRSLNALGASTVAAVAGPGAKPEEIIDQVHARLDELQGAGARHRTCAAGEAVFKVEEKALEAKRRGVPPGLMTGIEPLEEILQPMREGQAIIVAAATSMGKTALATNIAANLARLGTSVSYFTLEMNADDLGARLLAAETGIPVGVILSGRLSEDEIGRIQTVRQAITSWPLHIEACASLDTGQFTRRGRRHRRRYGTELLIVDYIGLMRGKGRSFYEQVSDITRGIKIAAGEIRLPILALAQLNREPERRSDGSKYEERYLRRRPKLSDLRDSRSIEQDADSVVFLHREEVYLAREKPPIQDLDAYQDWSAAMSRHKGRADLIIAKQRQGKTGLATCLYDEIRFRFGGL